MTFTTTITREIEVTVEYAFHKGYRETWGHYGGTPAEPDSVEILKVTEGGKPFDLTPAEESELEDEALRDHQDAEEAAMEARADAARDDRMERGNEP